VRQGVIARKRVLLPNSPDSNGYVEKAHLTHIEEFYEVMDSSFNVPELTDKLLNWEKLYNTFRPHQSLGYLTPQECLECY
jgi:transposase InsO family protein